MPEQFVLDQVLWNRTAVDRDERAVAPRPAVVDRAGRQLLAGTGLALDEDRRIRVGDALDQSHRLQKCRRLADQVANVESPHARSPLPMSALGVGDAHADPWPTVIR